MKSSMEQVESQEIKKNISGRRSIRDNYMNYEEILSRKKIHKDRSISEPPKSYSSSYINNNNKRLKTIREKHVSDDMISNQQGSSDDEYCIEDDDFSKSNSQLNESDLDLDIPESASHTPIPTLLTKKSRRINSETDLNESKRLTGFMGNRSKRFCASTSELSFASHLDTHKSLFSPKNNNNNNSRSGSLYGSNMSLNSTNSRLFMVNSPFYNGKTMFGGAASYPKRDINQSKVLRNPIQMRPSSSLSNSSNTSTKSEGGAIAPESNAAKRILEIMTQFSGPLKETRSMGSNISSIIKVPGLIQSRKRFGEEDLQLDRSISLTRPTAPYTRPITATSSTNKHPESPSILLNNNSKNSPQIPTMSQLLKMKRLQNNTERAREIANRSENFLNQIHEYKLPSQNDQSQSISSGSSINSNNNNSSFKMKSNITKNLLRNVEKNDLPPAPVNLPNIQLPELKSIPKFDIQLPQSSKASNNNNLSPKSITSNAEKSSSSSSLMTFVTASEMNITSSQPMNSEQSIIQKNPRSMATNTMYQFSKPICLSNGENLSSSLKISTDSFKFCKPTLIEELNATDIFKSAAKEPDNLFKNLVKQQKQQWECEACMVRNDLDRTKCLSCDTLKRDSGISSQASSIVSKDSPVNKTPPSDDLFTRLAAQQKKSQWECSECMTKNDLDKEKCLCCETPKPGSKQKSETVGLANSSGFKFGMPVTNVQVASDDLFKNLAAQQKKSQWECSDCMTSNDASKEKCACCEAPKPGSGGGVSKQFSFGMPVASSTKNVSQSVDPAFKKILEKQNASWECTACMTRNDQSRSKCICCEQAKPGSSDSKSQFSFGSKISSSVSLPAPSEVKFSFGIQPIQTSKSATLINKESDAETKKEDDKKIDEVDKPKPTFTFGINSSSNSELPQATPTFSIKASTSNTTTSFVMKSPQVDEKSKSDESAKNENSDKTPAFTFGSKTIENVVPEKKIAFGTDSAAGKDSSETNKPIGGFSFPIMPNTTTTTTENKSDVLKTNGGFSFGTSLKPSEALKEDNKSSGFKFSSDTKLTFPSQPTSTETPVVKTQSTFAFGSSQKPESTEQNQKPHVFGSFGSTTQALTTSTPFSLDKAAASKKDETAPALFAFGNAKPTSNSNMVFGSNINTTSSSSVTPIFGANSSTPTFGSNSVAPTFGGNSATPTFGANSTAPTFGGNSAAPTFGGSSAAPTFGGNSSTPAFGSTNNENTFGSKPTGFGNIQPSSNQPQKRAFDFGSSDVPQKKFDFRSQQQSQESGSTPFQFNAQQETAKPSFSFTSTSATPQAFNFTGASSNITNNNSSVQENLFQFGANGSSSTQGIFAFGVNTQPPQQPNSAPVMQFGATSTPSIAIPGINTFGVQQGANAPQRKILKAARRTVRR